MPIDHVREFNSYKTRYAGHSWIHRTLLLSEEGFLFIIVIKLKSLIESDEYRGEHSAPDKSSGTSMDLADQIWPADIYSNDAARLYGDKSADYNDHESISVIQSVRNKPNSLVKVYRAVPDINHEMSKKIKEYHYIVDYIRRFRFPPLNNDVVRKAQEEIGWDNNKLILYFEKKVEELQPQLKPNLSINNGDWVTVNKRYAIDHGRNALLGKYKIISKTVKAKHLYTDANSIHEWGYDVT
jgi:hypothetical protein